MARVLWIRYFYPIKCECRKEPCMCGAKPGRMRLLLRKFRDMLSLA